MNSGGQHITLVECQALLLNWVVEEQGQLDNSNNEAQDVGHLNR